MPRETRIFSRGVRATQLQEFVFALTAAQVGVRLRIRFRVFQHYGFINIFKVKII